MENFDNLVKSIITILLNDFLRNCHILVNGKPEIQW